MTSDVPPILIVDDEPPIRRLLRTTLAPRAIARSRRRPAPRR